MQTARLDQIVRQQDPGLKQAVELLARGEVREGVENLAQQGRVQEIADPEKRMSTIAENYAAHPRRLQGVAIYREGERQFSAGDRVQFTAPYKDKHVANRQLGTIEQIDAFPIASTIAETASSDLPRFWIPPH